MQETKLRVPVPVRCPDSLLEVPRWALIVGTSWTGFPYYARDLFGYRVTTNPFRALLRSRGEWGVSRMSCDHRRELVNDLVYIPRRYYVREHPQGYRDGHQDFWDITLEVKSVSEVA
jgi:hypothetical protein